MLRGIARLFKEIFSFEMRNQSKSTTPREYVDPRYENSQAL